jgi:hypothetical protein
MENGFIVSQAFLDGLSVPLNAASFGKEGGWPPIQTFTMATVS